MNFVHGQAYFILLFPVLSFTIGLFWSTSQCQINLLKNTHKYSIILYKFFRKKYKDLLLSYFSTERSLVSISYLSHSPNFIVTLKMPKPTSLALPQTLDHLFTFLCSSSLEWPTHISDSTRAKLIHYPFSHSFPVYKLAPLPQNLCFMLVKKQNKQQTNTKQSNNNKKARDAAAHNRSLP